MTADPGKGDVEVKLLIGCTPAEAAAVQHFLAEVLNLGVTELPLRPAMP